MKFFRRSIISRRSFLAGAATSAIAFGIPIGSSNAGLRMHGSATNNLLTARAMIGEGDVNGDSLAYLNHIKNGGAIAVPQGTTTPFPPQMDVNGYPVTTPSVPYNIGLPDFPIARYGVTMVVRWTGHGGGVLEFPGITFTVISEVLGTAGGVGTHTDRIICIGASGGYITVSLAPTGSANNLGGQNWKFTDWFGSITYDGTMGGLEFYPLMYETLRNSGEIFDPNYVALIKSINPRTIRAMDWCRVNNTNVTSRTNRMPTTYVCYNSQVHPPGIWGGTASGTSTFTCGAAPQTPVSYTDGEVIQVQFTSGSPAPISISSVNNNAGQVQLVMASTASLSNGQRVNYSGYIDNTGATNSFGQFTITVDSGTQITLQGTTWASVTVTSTGVISVATLNINSRGAKLLTDRSGSTIDTTAWPASAIVTLVYDLWLDVLIVSSTSPFNGQVTGGGLFAGVPLENLVALANKCHVNLHTNFPLIYDDASVIADTQYVRDNLASDLEWEPEVSNEPWNTFFTQTQIAIRRGVYLGFPNSSSRAQDGYYALRVRQVMALVATNWAPRSAAKLMPSVQVAAGSAAQTQSATNIIEGADLATVANGGSGNANWTAKIGGAVNYRTSGQKPGDFCKVFMYATYWNGSQIDQGGLTGGQNAKQLAAMSAAISNYNSGNPTAAYQWLDNDIRRGVSSTQDVASISSGNTFNITGHGFSVSSELAFSTTGGLPTGLVADKMYRPINVTANSFQIATLAAPAVAVTVSGGSGTLSTGQLGSSTKLWIRSLLFGYDPLTNVSFAPGWEAVVASYDTYRAGLGLAPFKVRLYEGGPQFLAPTVSQYVGVGLSTAHTVTFNIGSSPGVNWTAHPLKNGDRVTFAGGVLPNNMKSIDYFVMNSVTNGFDITPTYNNPYVPAALLLSGTPSGTTTATGCNTIDNLLEGWKNSSFGYQFITDVFNEFLNLPPGPGAGGSGIAGNHADVPTIFALQGFGIWSIMVGNSFSSLYQTGVAFKDFNH